MLLILTRKELHYSSIHKILDSLQFKSAIDTILFSQHFTNMSHTSILHCFNYDIWISIVGSKAYQAHSWFSLYFANSDFRAARRASLRTAPPPKIILGGSQPFKYSIHTRGGNSYEPSNKYKNNTYIMPNSNDLLGLTFIFLV